MPTDWEARLIMALQLMLDNVDYTTGACKVNEMVGFPDTPKRIRGSTMENGIAKLATLTQDVADALGVPVSSIDDLTSPVWRCRCEDWLIARGHHFSSRDVIRHLGCDWPECSARLVSAVWRRRSES